jgi:hypothetical protein
MLTLSSVWLPSNLQTFGFDSQLSSLILKSITIITKGKKVQAITALHGVGG